MDSKAKSKSETSLCEKSMQVVANIIRLSASLSIAQKTLQTTTTPKAAKDTDYSHAIPERQPLVVHGQIPDGRSFQKQRNRAKHTYLIEPVGSNESTATTHVIHEKRFDEVKPQTEDSVDGKAAEYIKKIRNKFACGL